MLPGYNHNIKYQDRVYHVQTEDSGVRVAHITTLLFIGGNVIAQARSTYDTLLQDPDLNQRVIELMQRQHKTMLRDLVDGRYDKEIAERSLNAATLNGPAPINVEAGAQHRASAFVAPAATPTRSPAPAPKSGSRPRGGGRSAGQAAAGKSERGEGKAAAETSESHIESLAPFLTTRTDNARPNDGSAAGTQPVAATQGAARPAQTTQTAQTTPTAQTAQTAATQQAGRQIGAPPRAASQSTREPGNAASTNAPVIEGERLKSAFAQGDKAVDDSIFGNLISPKPLDEVILSYLANKDSSDK